MTAEKIRAEAIERIARADYLRRYRADGFMWETTTEAIRGQHRATAALAVDALSDMLPTGVDVQYGWIDRSPDGAVVHREPAYHRYVTDWKVVAE